MIDPTPAQPGHRRGRRRPAHGRAAARRDPGLRRACRSSRRGAPPSVMPGRQARASRDPGPRGRHRSPIRRAWRSRKQTLRAAGVHLFGSNYHALSPPACSWNARERPLLDGRPARGDARAPRCSPTRLRRRASPSNRSTGDRPPTGDAELAGLLARTWRDDRRRGQPGRRCSTCSTRSRCWSTSGQPARSCRAWRATWSCTPDRPSRGSD